jgi:hypothetical protein
MIVKFNREREIEKENGIDRYTPRWMLLLPLLRAVDKSRKKRDGQSQALSARSLQLYDTLGNLALDFLDTFLAQRKSMDI